MRTFTRCLVVAAALVVMTVPAWSQTVTVPTVPVMTRADTLVAIDRLAKAIKAANPEYPNETLVPIGVFIRVPNPGGMDAFYKTEDWHRGELGCFWHVAAFHLFGKRMTPPETTPPPAPAVKAGFDLAAMLAGVMALLGLIPWWVLLLIIALTAIGYGAYYWHQRKRQAREEAEARERERQEAEAQEQERQAEEERRLDARRDQPVVPGGLSDDPNRAIEQVQAVLTLRQQEGQPQQNAETAEPGYLRALTDRKSFVTRVQHGDGITRDKRLHDGDRCYRVTVRRDEEEPEIQYWLQHCGNPCMVRKDGKFEMPEGWEFVPTGPAATVVPDPATEAETAAQQVEEAATTQVGRRNGRARDDKFTTRIEITSNGGTNPKTKQVINVTADRFVTAVALPGGATVTF